MTTEHRLLKYINPAEIHASKYVESGINEEDKEAFSNSIKQNGVIDPIIVSADGSEYKVITGERRLYYAKLHQLKDIPCIIWKHSDNSDVALAQLVDIAHRQKHTDEEKANAIANVYKSIGIKPQKAIQLVKQLHNEDYKNGVAKSQNLNTKRDIIGTPSSEFMNLFNKIGYTAPAQYKYLQLITNLEPEVLQYAEKRKITQSQKVLLTHSQLNKVLDEKTTNPKAKIEFKKFLTDKLAGKRESESRDIITQTIEDVRDGVHDLETGEVRDSFRKQKAIEKIVTEGEGGAVIAFLAASDAMAKAISVLTQGHLKLEKGEIGLDSIPTERILNVVKTHTLEIIKNMDDLQIRSLLAQTRLMNRFAATLIGSLEDEQEDRSKKKDMIQR